MAVLGGCGKVGIAILSPLRGLVISRCGPTACAVGCILTPLRGCAEPFSKYWLNLASSNSATTPLRVVVPFHGPTTLLQRRLLAPVATSILASFRLTRGGEWNWFQKSV